MFRDAKSKLIGQAPSRLSDLPAAEKGIYLLFSHNREPLYLGITASSGFRDRVFNRHVTGTGIDGNSHKLGWGYNVGPFYLARFNGSNPFTVQGVTIGTKDIALVREVRAAFIRENCRASYIAIPRPDDLSTVLEFKRYLEHNYEGPIKRELSLPWQDNKRYSVIPYDVKLRDLAWQFIDTLRLGETKLEVLTTMEQLFKSAPHQESLD